MIESILVDDVAVTCDKIVDMAESAVNNSNNVIRYWPIAIVLLSIAFLLLLVAIVVKYFVKRKLTISCLLLYMDY